LLLPETEMPENDPKSLLAVPVTDTPLEKPTDEFKTFPE
jgi:hypothetical protein